MLRRGLGVRGWVNNPQAWELGRGGAARGGTRRTPGADDILVQAALAALALRPEAREALLQGIQMGYLLLIQLRLPGLAELTHGSWGKAGQHQVLGPSQELGHPIPAHCQSQLLKVPRGWRTTEQVCWENSPGELPGWGLRTLCGGWREGPPAQGPWAYWVAVPAPGVGV